MPPPRHTSKPCAHTRLQLEPSAYAAEAGFEWANPACRLAAASRNGAHPFSKERIASVADARAAEAAEALRDTFPGPLILPWDELGWDPECEKQSFKEWLEGGRNRPTPARRTIYVAELPEVAEEVGFLTDWARPRVPDDAGTGVVPDSEVLSPIPAQDLVNYLAAFYQGFSVKLLPGRMRFKQHTKRYQPQSKPSNDVEAVEAEARCVAPETALVVLLTKLSTSKRINARPTPNGPFAAQLNLNDLLDVAIQELPRDAYAMILLTAHDLYEDAEDDFCCGRAYGGSRVCVVSTARYNPCLDDLVPRLDAAHAWPTAHCRAYVETACRVDGIAKGTRALSVEPSSPLQAAVKAAVAVCDETEKDLWFSRVARTAAHELGHCLGLAHCVYYACLMQSTAGLAEDYRQPPFLCPVCLVKVAHAAVETTGSRNSSDAVRAPYVKKHYEALVEACARWPHSVMFVAYEAWLRARLKLMD